MLRGACIAGALALTLIGTAAPAAAESGRHSR
jgi:hypothetical protein